MSKEKDIFRCFQKTILEPELHPMDPCGTKKYTDDEENGDAPSATAIGNSQIL